MKQQVGVKTIVIQILIAVLIAFPFFRIKYFDTFSFLLIIYHYFLIPIILVAIVWTLFWYFKHLRRLNKPTNSKFKIIARDIIMVVILTFVDFLIISGLTLSALITTNAYLRPQRTITINEPVIKYEPYVNKQGRLQHYITFKNPTDDSLIRLEVYRPYNVGETFQKEMRIGKWGLLYSMD